MYCILLFSLLSFLCAFFSDIILWSLAFGFVLSCFQTSSIFLLFKLCSNIFCPHEISSIKFDPLFCVHRHALFICKFTSPCSVFVCVLLYLISNYFLNTVQKVMNGVSWLDQGFSNFLFCDSFWKSFFLCDPFMDIVVASQQWWSLETWSRFRDVSRDPFFGVSISVSKDFGLGLELFVSRLCMDYFYEVLQEGAP